MKHAVWLALLVVTLFTPETFAAGPARVAIRDAVTGMVQESQWMDMSEAIKIGMDAIADRTVQDCWIEEKRKLFFFIPLPSRRINVIRTRTLRTLKKESFRTPFFVVPIASEEYRNRPHPNPR